MVRPTRARAVRIIERAGVLLVFPIKDRPSLPSLWGSFYPGQLMSWDWSEEGDDRVAELWHLRAELSTCGEVVYTKWFKNRGTLFSLELLSALLSHVSPRSAAELSLGRDAQSILDALNDDSPLGSKALKQAVDMEGKENSARFERALKELWARFLIVAYGEIEEGGYPSLALGSSRLLFEDTWDESLRLPIKERDGIIARYLLPESDFGRYYTRLRKRGLF